MQVVELEFLGVHKLVSVTDANTMNDLKRLGYKPVMKNGNVVIRELTTENVLNHIADTSIRDALTKINNSNTVSKEVVDKSK